MRSQLSVSRRPGRPRQFDEHAVLEAALAVFWSYGYAGGGLDALGAATGLSRSSLYRAFGDKRGLFLAVVDHYAQTRIAPLLDALDAAPLDSGLEVFFEGLARLGAGDGTQSGCLVSCVLSDAAGADPVLRAAFAARYRAVGDRLARRLDGARQAGEIARGIDPVAIGAMLGALAHGLMLGGRAGLGPGALNHAGRTARALLMVATPAGARR